MSILAIDLNDAGLRAMDATTFQLLPLDGRNTVSVGYALHENKKNWVTGTEAAAQSSIQPLNINNRFWDDLSKEGAAEIAYFHLQKIWKTVGLGVDAVQFAVPSDTEPYQLGVLHGICQALGIPVKSFVAAAVVSAPTCLHIDVRLHRTIFSLVEEDDLKNTSSDSNIGLLGLQKQWAKGMQSEFVRNTRFDPMHKAETEQQLMGQLHPLLQRFSTADAAAIEIETYRINLTRGMLAEWSHTQQAAICSTARRMLDEQSSEASIDIHLSQTAGLIPGLNRVLEQQLNVGVQTDLADAALKKLLHAWQSQQIPPDASNRVLFHTRWGAPGTTENTHAAKINVPPPLHKVPLHLKAIVTTRPACSKNHGQA